ncbi:hypothetical protein K443DRAFT_682200 [Laccaria amethystina LaAM-08-1]|uniref:Uncharacterized protein n=1 Tax=Laccaria amethystina LaAM-08-1 TaxID=1095629 RepID=A0A0C9XG78_9AGAR|nr:hypothetical protein K443DRAFT_682200 [Laccaria amethystina LaAM-08-1]
MGDRQSGRLNRQQQQSVMLGAIVYTSEELSIVTETWYGIRLWHIEQCDTLGKKSSREKLRPTLTTKDSLADFYLMREI